MPPAAPRGDDRLGGVDGTGGAVDDDGGRMAGDWAGGWRWGWRVHATMLRDAGGKGKMLFCGFLWMAGGAASEIFADGLS